ncbi:hypothetical protein, variant [Verruconis gallopava]|uniref:Uncharacterized protein n=1 Tax=Verruconis gallopava TaxID=253628 RepID=A0A0D1YIX3_9PEZI|nr:uncharacterized protein PV09_07587 [Verruconis gallopava]XP_016210696.1 hypothetical protein, variant [Verruconis gallopava]KIW00826.1 hypothetical protein PV09_07587 [Verruconis gallopava]KIW00827.1 hypothetical protein, variant [Verruconis gallopava]
MTSRSLADGISDRESLPASSYSSRAASCALICSAFATFADECYSATTGRCCRRRAGDTLIFLLIINKINDFCRNNAQSAYRSRADGLPASPAVAILRRALISYAASGLPESFLIRTSSTATATHTTEVVEYRVAWSECCIRIRSTTSSSCV